MRTKLTMPLTPWVKLAAVNKSSNHTRNLAISGDYRACAITAQVIAVIQILQPSDNERCCGPRGISSKF